MATPPLIAGLYGKVPSKGDFLNRRLPGAVVDVWTGWLDRCIASAKVSLDQFWLPTYLTSPPWRFALEPGLLGSNAFLGVMASSLDKVQRTYPIAAFLELPPGVSLEHLIGDPDPILAALEGAILEAIDGSLDIESAADRVLAAAADLASLTSPGGLLMGRGVAVKVGAMPITIASLAQMLRRSVAPGTGPVSLWWQTGWADLPPTAVAARGLPHPALFTALLDGQWADVGVEGEGEDTMVVPA